MPFDCLGESGFVDDGVFAFEFPLLARGGVTALGEEVPFICTEDNEEGCAGAALNRGSIIGALCKAR